MNPLPDEDLEELVGRIADEFTDRLHRGERPEVEEYARRYPTVADLLRQVLPTVAALGTPSPNGSLAEPDAPPEIGPYEVLERIGRGGMGVVYKARDKQLDRLVAVKILRAGADERERFLLEGRSVARLRHPNIVQVFEVGEHDGRPYLVLEFCPGGSLATYLTDHRLTPAAAAELLEQVADAVHAAHESGILHRDIKPANVLLTVDGPSLTPKVTDFGLAKQLGATASDHTQTGAIVGTPGYMAPEQAAGGRLVGPTADVYALGAVLYQCLTGRPPFDGNSTLEVLEKVRTEDPVPPRRIDPDIPRDLDTICLKCLSKAQHERYATARELANDLCRFREGRAITARPVGRVERAVKWVRRRPTAAAAYMLLGLSLLLGAAGSGAAWLWQRAAAAHGRADFFRLQAEDGLARETQARERLDRVNYRRQVDLAYRDWNEGRTAAAVRRLDECAPNLRDWQWHYLRNVFHDGRQVLTAPPGWVWTRLAFAPDGRTLLAAEHARNIARERTVAAWNLGTAQPAQVWGGADRMAEDLAVLPGTERFVTLGADGTVRRWELQKGRAIDSIVSPSGRRASTLIPRPSEGRVLVAVLRESVPSQTEVALLDAATGEQLGRVTVPAEAADLFAYAPDGPSVALVKGDRVSVFDPTAGKLRWPARMVGSPVRQIAFDPTGRHIGVRAADNTVRMWRTADGVETLTVRSDHPLGSVPMPFAFSPDGGRVAVADLNLIRVWDLATAREVRVYRGHQTMIWALAFSPDGAKLAACAVGETYLWDLAVEPGVAATVRAPVPVHSCAFRPGRDELACGCNDHQVRLFDYRTGRLVKEFAGEKKEKGFFAPVGQTTFDRNGRYLLAGSVGGWAKVWDAETGTVVFSETSKADLAFGSALAGDGSRVAVAGGGTVRVISIPDGQSVATLDGFSQVGVVVALSPDGRTLATADSGSGRSGVIEWDLTTGVPRTLARPDAALTSLAYTPDGRLLAGTSLVPARQNAVVRVWDRHADNSEIAAVVTTATASVRATTFTPDGRQLVLRAIDPAITFYDHQLGQEALALRLAAGSFVIGPVAFSPDGHLLAVPAGGQVVTLDAPRGSLLLTLSTFSCLRSASPCR